MSVCRKGRASSGLVKSARALKINVTICSVHFYLTFIFKKRKNVLFLSFSLYQGWRRINASEHFGYRLLQLLFVALQSTFTTACLEKCNLQFDVNESPLISNMWLCDFQCFSKTLLLGFWFKGRNHKNFKVPQACWKI